MMAERVIDVDDDALVAAQGQLGTTTVDDTVNEALRRVARLRESELDRALQVLGELEHRDDAWR